MTKEEKEIINKANPTPTDDCPEMTRKELDQFHPVRSGQKKIISINIDVGVIDYFKSLSAETGVPYQTLINMYLLQCKEEQKKPVFV